MRETQQTIHRERSGETLSFNLPPSPTWSSRPKLTCVTPSSKTADESPLARKRRARKINRELAEFFPGARCELDFTNAYELLIATVLSAQTTDVRVNQITPKLFSRYPDARALAEADRAELEEIIRPTGFYRAKTDSLLKLGAALVADHDGEVPQTLEELTALAGVGRKTANVVLGNVFDVPGITVDTHVARVSQRLGWTEAKNALRIEKDLAELFDPKDWVMLCHRLIFLGRRVCHARKPDCAGCPISRLCPSAFTF